MIKKKKECFILISGRMIVYLTDNHYVRFSWCSFFFNENHYSMMSWVMFAFVIVQLVHVKVQFLFEAKFIWKKKNVFHWLELLKRKSLIYSWINLTHLFDFFCWFCCLCKKSSIWIILNKKKVICFSVWQICLIYCCSLSIKIGF